MPAEGLDLAVLVLMMMGLISGGQDAAQDNFAYDAVLQANDLTLSVDSMAEVLVGPSEEKINDLLKRLASEDFDAREKAYDALVKLGPGAIPKLEARMRESQDMEVRMRCKKAVEEMRANEARYLKIKRVALAGLAHLGAKDKVDLVAKYLDDKDPGVRGEAAVALGKIGGDKALAHLRAHVQAAVKSGEVNTPEAIAAYAPHASKDELKAMGVLLGAVGRDIDFRLLAAYAAHMELPDLLEMVRKYVVASGDTPPPFIREFLVDVYDMKNDSRYNWVPFDANFPWAAFCEKGGTLRKIDATQAAAVCKTFADGLAGADRVFLMQECLRAVPAGSLFVAGADAARVHEHPLVQDLAEFVGTDPVMNSLFKMTLACCGPFHTDAAAFYFDPQGFSGRDVTGGYVMIGRYDSAFQTEAFVAMMGKGWERCVYNGVTYLRSMDDRYGPELASICFYGDRYVLIGLESETTAAMEAMIARLTGEMPSILADKSAMDLLDQETLSANAWAIARPGTLGAALMRMMHRYKDMDEKNLDIEAMAALSLFCIRDCVATVDIDDDVLSLKLRARYGDPAFAKRVLGYVDKLRQAAVQGLGMAMSNVDQESRPAIVMLQNFLKSAKFTQDGSVIQAEAKMNTAPIRYITRALYYPMFSADITRHLRKTFSPRQRLEAKKRAAEARIAFYEYALKSLEEQKQALEEEEKKLNAQPDSDEKKTRLDQIGIEKQNNEVGRNGVQEYIDEAVRERDEIEKEISALPEGSDVPQGDEDTEDEYYKDEMGIEKEKIEIVPTPAPSAPTPAPAPPAVGPQGETEEAPAPTPPAGE